MSPDLVVGQNFLPLIKHMLMRLALRPLRLFLAPRQYQIRESLGHLGRADGMQVGLSDLVLVRLLQVLPSVPVRALDPSTGFGHMASNCGTERPGGAKAGKGKGKAKGKDGNYQNYQADAKAKGKGKTNVWSGALGGGKGDKGKGKGYQGSCFKCGKVGHKQWECQAFDQTGINYAEEEDDETQTHDLGGVTMVAGVEEYWPEVGKISRMP